VQSGATGEIFNVRVVLSEAKSRASKFRSFLGEMLQLKVGVWHSDSFFCFVSLLLPGKTFLRSDLRCVDWDVKPYALTDSWPGMAPEGTGDFGRELAFCCRNNFRYMALLYCSVL